jgi:hypothetical protein
VTPLSIPNIEPDADNLTAALAYAKAGWYVLPVKRGTKHPGSVVGEHWQDKSSRDPKVITARFAGTGTDHGIAIHCGRSGLVVIDVDHPELVPVQWRQHLNTAPYQSSRPDTAHRGHYIFAMPAERSIGNPDFDGGEIRGLNGVIIVAPSVHKNGGEYRWIRTGPVPVLPDVIADTLTDSSPGSDAATDEQVRAFLVEHHQTMDRELILGPVHRLEAQIAKGKSRHVSTVKVLVWAMEEAAAGLYPADDAQAAIRGVFLDAIGRQRKPDDRVVTGSAAESEFQGILAWSVGQANQKTPEQLADRRGRAQRNSSHIEATELSTEAINASATTTSAALNDEEFWEARASLRTIYTTSLYYMSAPWAVLAHTAARALALVRPNAALPDLIGGPGSLNWFAAVAAASGDGKGAAARVAKKLVPPSLLKNVPIRNIGSGEGIIDAYVIPTCGGAPPRFHESVIYMGHEIRTMTALANRSGSTLMGTLCSGFSGETLGFSYRGKPQHLQEDTYRMTLVLSVQPGLAGGLLDDHHGGTPQRFMWFPGIDARITDNPKWPDGVLTLPDAAEWRYPRELQIPDEAAKLIRSERAKRARGEQNALDGHALFVREKFAYALTVLDGRVEMSSEDWELSGIAMEVSDSTRDRVAVQLVEAAEAEAAERGRLAGIVHASADDEKQYQQTQRLKRLAEWSVKHLRANPDGLTEGALRDKAPNRDRRLVRAALDHLLKLDRVTYDAVTKRWKVAQ